MIWSPNLYVMILGNCIVNGSAGCIWLFSTTSIGILVPSYLMGRVMSVSFIIFYLGKIFAYIVCGLLIDFADFSPRLICLVATCGYFLIFLYFVIWWIVFRKVKIHTMVDDDKFKN